MNINKWALNELELIEKNCKSEDGLVEQKIITRDIMQIINVFENQGHSGMSAGYATSIINRLLNNKPLLPLTGEESEWGEVEEWNKDKNIQQNLRCWAVFRENFDNSTATYMDGKIFSEDGGNTWFTNRNSELKITFPYYVPTDYEYVYLDKNDNVITREQAKEIFNLEG